MKKSKSTKKTKKVEIEDDDIIGKKTDALNTDIIEVIPDQINGEVVEEDEVTVYRDIMTMTDDERFSSDDHMSLSTIRLSPPPAPAWYDDVSKLKFKVGQLVVFKGSKDSTVYYVSGPDKRENFYTIVPDKSLKSIAISGEQIKLAPKDSKWTKYWDTVPVIKAPSWKDKDIKNNVKKINKKK